MQSIPRKDFTNALMLLEMAWQGLDPIYGTVEDCVLAAHSILQAASGAGSSWDGAESFLATIQSGGPYSLSCSSEDSAGSGLNTAQAKTIFALLNVGGWAGTDAIENHGGNLSSATKLARDAVINRRGIVTKAGFDSVEYMVTAVSRAALIAYLSRTTKTLADPAIKSSDFHSIAG